MEDDPAEVPTRPRRPILRLLVAAAAVLVVAGGVTTILLSGREVAGTPLMAWPKNTAPPLLDISEADARKACRDHGHETLVIYFGRTDSDAAMRRAADELREDPRVDSVSTLTQQEAYERFKEIFADQPDLVDLATPESLPASVTLLPVAGSSVDELHTALQARDLQGVDSFQLGCDEPAR